MSWYLTHLDFSHKYRQCVSSAKDPEGKLESHVLLRGKLVHKSTVCWLVQADSSLSTDRLRRVATIGNTLVSRPTVNEVNEMSCDSSIQKIHWQPRSLLGISDLIVLSFKEKRSWWEVLGRVISFAVLKKGTLTDFRGKSVKLDCAKSVEKLQSCCSLCVGTSPASERAFKRD